jgi:transposase InsO family protein
VEQVKAMGIKQVLSTPGSPWQRAYVERVIGTIRRECLDHLIVFNEGSLHRHLRSFLSYYHGSRTHLDCKRTHQSRGQFNRRKPGGSSPSRSWVAFITGTSAELPEQNIGVMGAP